MDHLKIFKYKGVLTRGDDMRDRCPLPPTALILVQNIRTSGGNFMLS